MNFAPSAGSLQAYEVVIVKGTNKKEWLAQAAFGQKFIIDASLLLVVFANLQKSGRKYGQRGRQLFCIQDATIAAGE